MSDFFITSEQVWDAMARGRNLRVFDVRRPAALEPSSRFVPGARWRDHLAARDWAPQTGTIVLTCMHGHNVSQIATATLRSLGYDARALAGGIDGWREAGLPTVGQSQFAPIAAAKPSIWVTRINPKIDRVACPWLIRRFIDPDAEFSFVEAEWVIDVAEELGGVAFDTPGAPIEHDGPRCSFDTLLEAFGLDDPSLQRLAVIVRGADTDRNDLAPEAAGLLAIALGNAARSTNDHEVLTLGFPVYDAMYAWLRLAASERHGWQPMAS